MLKHTSINSSNSNDNFFAAANTVMENTVAVGPSDEIFEGGADESWLSVHEHLNDIEKGPSCNILSGGADEDWFFGTDS